MQQNYMDYMWNPGNPQYYTLGPGSPISPLNPSYQATYGSNSPSGSWTTANIVVCSILGGIVLLMICWFVWEYRRLNKWFNNSR